MKNDEIHYLCGYCAEDLGGNWPDGHVATLHHGECDVCAQEWTLAHVHDWCLDTRGKPYKPKTYEWD